MVVGRVATRDAIGDSMAINVKQIKTQIQYHALQGDVALTTVAKHGTTG